MKVLLTAINAKYIHSNLAVYNLKACAGIYESSVKIAEYTINNYLDEILQSIYKEKADVIAFSCYIWNLEMVERLIGLIHQVAPATQLWLGGPEVSYDAEMMLKKHPQLTGIMVGEGEETFRELMAWYHKDIDDISAVKGLVYRADDNHIMCNSERDLMDLDKIPFVYNNIDNFTNKIIYYESSRGCPFSCSYCLSSIDKRVRFRDPELVKQELKFFIDHQVPQVKFVDRTFNCKHSHSMAIWQFIKEYDKGKTNFHFEVAADLFNDEELALLKSLRPGLIQLEIGIQSTNEMTIKAINRQMNLNKLAANVTAIYAQRNIHQHMDLIAGLPYEGIECFKESFNWVYQLHPDQFQLGFLKVLKGSMMHRCREEYQMIYQTHPVYEVMATKWLNYDQILDLKAVESMVEVYYNSGQFKNSLDYLGHFFESPYELYEEMGRFYAAHGYSEVNHSRMARYTILLEFVNEKGFGEAGVFEQILLYDLYLREKLKSRPAWAPDTSAYKMVISDFYRNPQNIETYLKAYQHDTIKQTQHLTHIEPFRIDIERTVREGVPRWRDNLILFDYRERDLLNNEGKTVIIEGD